ncbi:MAG: hypothetical protein B6A08_07405 [Sorangiineae bacterium NIC37A_2]|nr:MAG: hypothetical protein B6A08_07405 [Sorangiineae bacterium NIC37A_2]
MTPLRLILFLVTLLWVAATNLACEKCAVGSVGALKEKQGGVDRDFAPEREKWHVAEIGTRFRPGDGLMTAPRATALIALRDGSVVELEGGTLLRFLPRDGGAGESAFDVLLGVAAFEVAPQGGTLTTSLGTARLKGGSRVTLERFQDTLSLSVERGAADVAAIDGSSFELEAGERVVLAENSVKIELAERRRGQGTEAHPSPGPGETSLPSGEVDVVAGTSLVIHDPEPPVKVRLLFGAICDEATVRLSGGSPLEVRGRRAIAEALPQGTYSYAVHCSEGSAASPEPTQSGTITVLADAGAIAPPSQAPSALIELNGRQYTVLYQDQLPQVTLRWPDAPADATDLKLHLSNLGRTRTLSASSSSYGFASGALAEGTYQAYFTGGGSSSAKSVIAIAFDPAAPIVTLSSPMGNPVSGSAVTVEGSALPGWTVALEGQPLGQDDKGHFSVTHKMPEAGPLTVEASHPERGRHVYLRRPSR